MIGCGGGGGSSQTGPPVITSVSVTGSNFAQAGLCENFTATVKGSGNFDRSVKWFVNDVMGGTAATGIINGTGNYCAPPQPPTGNPVTIKAVANGDPTKSDTVSTRVIEIQISPTQSQLHVGDTQQFTAIAEGAVNNSIVWMVNGKLGGDLTVGTISATGLYSAPAQVPSQAISVEAATADTDSAFAAASISVSGRILISPQNPQVPYGGTQQFTATIVGTNDSTVNWRAQYGTISGSGLYTASATQSPDTITAWSAHADGNTTVQVTTPQPVITAITPQPATAGQQITISGQNLQPPITAMFPDAAGGQIPVSGANANGSSVTVTVPQGSVTGPFFVQTQPGGLPPANSNTLTFQRLARLRIRSPKRDLSAGESVTFQYALLGDSTPRTVNFSSDVGSFSGATYLAPGGVSSDTFAHISACIAGSQSCDTLMLGLHPFRIAPDVPLVGIGQSLQLSAILGGNVTGANWDLLAGGGTITAGGLYTAGTRVQDGGPAIASATANASTENVQMGVTGAFPGLLNRVYDYVDQHDPNMEGSNPGAIAAIGNRLYVASSNHLGAYADSYFWIDIYDISDPLHPTWLNAVEANSAGPIYVAGAYLYSYANVDIAVPGYPNTITVYKTQNGIPFLKARAVVPQWWSISRSDGVVTLAPLSDNSPPGSAEIILYDVTSGTITSRDLTIALPADAKGFRVDTAMALGNRLFVSQVKDDLSGGYILTYDLSVSPPQLLGAIDGRSLAFYAAPGNFLFGALGGMDTYDVSGQLPQYLSHVDFINAWQLSGTTLLAITGQQGFRMVDMSNPQAPRVTATLFDGVITGYDLSAMVGNYVYAAQGDAGITVYDPTQSGGPVYEARLYGGGTLWSEIFDEHLRYPYLYGATATSDGGVLNVYDVSTKPTTRVGQYFDPNQESFAVQSSGNYLYLGMTNRLDVFSIATPTSPSLSSTVNLPVVSLARKDNTLFAGTFDNRLVTLDISNAAHPQIQNSLPLSDLPTRLRVAGNLLLMADNQAGLLIYDITIPASPVLLSQTTGLITVNDVAIDGTTIFAAADVDGLATFDASDPSHPVLLSKTALASIDPFTMGQVPNQALSLVVNNKIVYVGTFFDNGIVFGFDYATPSVPRLVSLYAYGDFILTTVDTMLFHGNDLLVGGSLGYVFPLEQVDMTGPFDSINQYFPPAALQNPGSFNVARNRSPLARNGKRGNSVPSADPRFFKTPPERIPHHTLGAK